MKPRNLARALRDHAITAAIILALFLVLPLSIPSVRSRIVPAVSSLATLHAFDDDDTPRDNTQPPGQPGTLKKIVTAPVRLVARLFRNKETSKDQNQIAKSSSKRSERLTVVPMTRITHGVEGEESTPANDEALSVATTTERVAAAYFDQAIDFHEKGRLDAAIEKLVAAVSLRPNFAEAYNLLAVCYDERSQYHAAQEEYKKAIKVEPVNARFLNNLGYSYYLAGDHKNAIKWYKKALKVTPDDRRLHNNIGLAYGRKGEYAQAFEHFTYAVGETGAHLNLGYVYSQQGRYEEAIKQYEVALRAQPQSLPALSNLAQLYERVGRVREAALLSEQYKKLSLSAQQQATGQK